jgi:2-oxoglutarate dehydrogenase E1 component
MAGMFLCSGLLVEEKYVTAMGNLKALLGNTHLSGGSAAYLEAVYETYLQDPEAVSPEWRDYFEELKLAGGTYADVPHAPIRDQFRQAALHAGAAPDSRVQQQMAEHERKQVRVLQLINAYRFRGHQYANLSPLGIHERPHVPDLDLEYHNLADADLNLQFNTGSFLFGRKKATLKEILHALRATYCGTIGAEYMHITDTVQKRWIQERLEMRRAQPNFVAETKRRIFERITATEGLERYLHSRYVGQKRFSLEGGEALIPMLDDMVQRAGKSGVEEVIVGMAHRGRLNVLVNILGKSPTNLFQEFEGKYDPDHLQGSGDVKYHKGFSSDIRTPGGPLHLVLAFNPSHLEIVSPVVEGSVRARQERRGAGANAGVLPVLIHGDAAIAGQGVVMETMNMSQARGYATGGTVHIVINNQVGFTTSNPLDARSTLYCTDVFKMVQAPIFHVNGDDPEAVVFVSQLALDYRNEFERDVVIDMVCYRRHGHNEADEPAVTQPQMYQRIRELPTLRQLHGERLTREGVLREGEVDAVAESYRDKLESGAIAARDVIENGKGNKHTVDWSRFHGIDWRHPVDTSLPQSVIKELTERLTQLPEGLELHPRVAKIIDDRRKMGAGALAMDWGFAETLAYAALLRENYAIRISGQDCGRGTFFHRHAVLHNQKEDAHYIPLQHLAEGQPQFRVIDSLLSEEAVLGFEYGYATTEPDTLVIWEAQFGDFANGAQVVIDQFISSGESKWGRLCGLVMFLPHGYEGQGPEHSSARLERYLQLCAEQNIQVCVPSTPAQMFHMLRRQALRPYRKPLVVMTPKSLLRHKLSTSSLEDISEGRFRPVIPEVEPIKPTGVRKVVLCSGKVYFDLYEARQARAADDVAILRVEQLYPFPGEELSVELKRYTRAREVVWCQEEPKNQGAWFSSKHHLEECLRTGQSLSYAGRDFSASPATGYFSLHVQQQAALVDQALS